MIYFEKIYKTVTQKFGIILVQSFCPRITRTSVAFPITLHSSAINFVGKNCLLVAWGTAMGQVPGISMGGVGTFLSGCNIKIHNSLPKLAFI